MHGTEVLPALACLLLLFVLIGRSVRRRTIALPSVNAPGTDMPFVRGQICYRVTIPFAPSRRAEDIIRRNLKTVVYDVLSTATLSECFFDRGVVTRRIVERMEKRLEQENIKIAEVTITEFPAAKAIVKNLLLALQHSMTDVEWALYASVANTEPLSQDKAAAGGTMGYV